MSFIYNTNHDLNLQSKRSKSKKLTLFKKILLSIPFFFGMLSLLLGFINKETGIMFVLSFLFLFLTFCLYMVIRPKTITLTNVLPINGTQLQAYLQIINFILDENVWEIGFNANNINSFSYGEIEVTSSMLNGLYEKGYLHRKKGVFTLNKEKFKYYWDMTSEGKEHPLEF